jgi:hypothetical protein
MKRVKMFLILLFIGIYMLQGKGQVVVHKSDNMNDLIEKHITINKNNMGKLNGFSVQICFESGINSREKAEKIRTLFLSKYPKCSAYVSFKEPNFRVKVGDFRTRADARGFKETIAADFPQGFVIRDEVRYPKHVFEITE